MPFVHFGTFAEPAHPASVQQPKIAQRKHKHHHAHREADIAVRDSKVRIMPACDAIEQQRHDADERRREKRRKTRRQAH